MQDPTHGLGFWYWTLRICATAYSWVVKRIRRFFARPRVKHSRRLKWYTHFDVSFRIKIDRR